MRIPRSRICAKYEDFLSLVLEDRKYFFIVISIQQDNGNWMPILVSMTPPSLTINVKSRKSRIFNPLTYRPFQLNYSRYISESGYRIRNLNNSNLHSNTGFIIACSKPIARGRLSIPERISITSFLSL